MKGTVLITSGTDLTNPADPYWGLDVATFRDSQSRNEPPPGISTALVALWWAGKGEWDKAHELAQNDEGADAAWVHAYLHRAEGDLGNARYWYGRAGRAPATGALDQEWNAIAEALLGEAAAAGTGAAEKR